MLFTKIWSPSTFNVLASSHKQPQHVIFIEYQFPLKMSFVNFDACTASIFILVLNQRLHSARYSLKQNLLRLLCRWHREGILAIEHLLWELKNFSPIFELFGQVNRILRFWFCVRLLTSGFILFSLLDQWIVHGLIGLHLIRVFILRIENSPPHLLILADPS